ncbi:hypothetical protein Dimus_027845 [Dionaea muscipula]
MSAIVCGKRSFFEELPTTGTPVSKKLRCSSSTSPVRFSSLSPFSPPRNTLLDRLRETFPQMDQQVLEKVLEECGNDIDAAIKRLHELHLGSSECNSVPVAGLEKNSGEDGVDANGDDTTGDPANQNTLPADGAQWVEWLVREMLSATSLDDAHARAARLLEMLEKSINTRARVEAAETYQKVVLWENIMLKEQNTILKHAVVIQHERQKEYEDMARELQHLRQLLPQYQEQLRNLEVSNYTLRMHLKQAQQSSGSIPGRFYPDVF